MGSRRAVLGIVAGLALLAMAMGILVLRAPARPDAQPSPQPSPQTSQTANRGATSGTWVFLSDLAPIRAQTGWLAVANDGLPAKDAAFAGSPLQIQGKVYEKGLGTYPLSEIVYALDGQYASLASEVGIDDTALRGGAAQFLVFADGVRVYDSDVVKLGSPPAQVEVSIAGVQELRLVTVDRSEGSTGTYGNWADARLFRPDSGISEEERRRVRSSLESQLEVGRQARTDEAARLASSARDEKVRLGDALAGLPGAQDGVSVAWDEAGQRLILANDRLAVSLGLGGKEHGRLTVLDLLGERFVARSVGAHFRLTPPGKSYSLPEDTVLQRPDSYRFVEVDDAAIGRGKQLQASLSTREEGLSVQVLVTLFEGRSTLLYQIVLDQPGIEKASASFTLLDSADPARFLVGESAHYVTDFSRFRHVFVYDDGLPRRESVGAGKPVYVWSEQEDRGLILAALDESREATRFSLRVDPGHVNGKLGFITGQATLLTQPGEIRSPRLYLELVDASQPLSAFAGFRSTMSALYPPLPVPSWVKYQWLSWYTYYMDINEDVIRSQIDYIADNLADLGPWHVLVDAGWFVAEGREGAGWRNVDSEKFPSGLRELVDYAHSRGVRVVLYLSVPYLDSRQLSGDWLGLGNVIRNFPDLLVKLGKDDWHESFAFDFQREGTRVYWQEVLDDFFAKYDVDGIKIDGLGNAEGAILDPRRRNTFGLVGQVTGQTMDIYRLMFETATSYKDDVYIESGWLNPLFANPNSHTFRYGDEAMRFSNAYPFPGLVEHVNYAIVQKAMLGQRPNMGALFADPNDSSLKRWWLGAGLALGTQVVLSFDLNEMAPETLSAYREMLVHYNAFQGETYLGPGLPPDVFATRVGETTYLGILNRQPVQREITVSLAEYSLGAEEYLAYDAFDGEYSRVAGSLTVQAKPQSFRLFILRREPGVMWTNSSFTVSPGQGRLEIVARGPEAIPGFMDILSPEPSAVLLDGEELTRADTAEAGQYAYDTANGVLRLRYPHDREHEIAVEFWLEGS